MIYLYVKGNATQALQAVIDHGIHPTDSLVGPYVTSPTDVRPDYLVSEFFIKNECEPGIERWWQETTNLMATNKLLPPGKRPSWPVGTLLMRLKDDRTN